MVAREVSVSPPAASCFRQVVKRKQFRKLRSCFVSWFVEKMLPAILFTDIQSTRSRIDGYSGCNDCSAG